MLYYSFFSAIAWTMSQPVLGGGFHLFISIFGLAAAFGLAFLFGRKSIVSGEKLLFFCGMLLLIAELLKQGFLLVIVYQGQFNWWYFPFQLCSIPMYLCLFYPLAVHWGFAAPVKTFLQDFGLLGGIMAVIVPEGFLWPYWFLTLHGFFWHFLLVFLGVYCHFLGVSHFFSCLPIYFFCIGIAVLVNTGVQILIYPKSYADMFYINCFFPSEQPIFSEISLALGNFCGHLAYIFASCIGAGIIHLILSHFMAKPPESMSQ